MHYVSKHSHVYTKPYVKKERKHKTVFLVLLDKDHSARIEDMEFTGDFFNSYKTEEKQTEKKPKYLKESKSQHKSSSSIVGPLYHPDSKIYRFYE